MPEGDTIHRSATSLARALVGVPLRRFEADRLSGPGPAAGTVVEGVEARGKYLTIRFGDGSALETHMRMTGSWHLYRPGERWRRQRGSARAVLTTDDWVAVCFSAPHVVLLPPRSPGSGSGSGSGVRLGPDLCSPDPDLGEVVRRLDRSFPPETPIVDALLDQRVFCGVGNVYKSEVLHAEGIHPDTPLGALGADQRRRLAATAHRLLRANLGGGPRTTVVGGLAVYGRVGRACRRCGTAIERGLRGPHQRTTFWCPGCQPGGHGDGRPGFTTPVS